jgi:hypothetical protein
MHCIPKSPEVARRAAGITIGSEPAGELFRCGSGGGGGDDRRSEMS